MTVENLWYDCKVYKGDNYEKNGDKFSYEYNKDDIHFS